jgi:hypothetical protein
VAAHFGAGDPGRELGIAARLGALGAQSLSHALGHDRCGGSGWRVREAHLCILASQSRSAPKLSTGAPGHLEEQDGGTGERNPMTASKKDIAPGRQVVAGLFGVVQLALAFLAFWDLAHRPATQVRGPKPAWIPVILINGIGPLAYFYVHRNR